MKKIFYSTVLLIILLCYTPMVGFAASKPSAPTISSSITISNSSIKITWGSVSGATKYRVDQRRTDETDYKTLTSSCTSTSYTATGLTSGSTYYYRVYAINSAGISSRSVTYEAHTAPDAPTISSVNRDSDNALTITWNKVSGATKYKIMYRRADKSDYSTLVSNVTGTTYTNTGLSSGSRYYYRVYAIREGDTGNQGSRTKKDIESARSETKGNYTKISRPSNNIDNNNPSHVILTWKQSYGDNDYSYEIYRKAPSESVFTKIARTQSLTYTDTTAASGIIYKYKINTVLTSAGSSCTWSDEFGAGAKITKPISITPYNTSSMKISWDSLTSEIPVTYILKKWNGSEYVSYATTNNTSYIDTGLSIGGSYSYYIQVRDSSDHYLTSTYDKSAVLQVPDLGTGFYASIMTKSGDKPILATDARNAELGSTVGTANTLWRFDKDSDGSYKISSVADGYVLDAYSWGNESGTNVVTSTAHDDNKSNQRWYLFEETGGYALLPSYNMNIALDVSSSSFTAGTNIQLWSRNNSNAQIFYLNKSNTTQMKAPALNIETGDTDTATNLSWNSVTNAAYYAVSIYKAGELYKQDNTTDTEYSVQLPIDTYSAVVTAINNYENTQSETSEFQVGCTHSYGEWVTQLEATCTEDGVASRICDKCGNTETTPIPKLNHSYTEITEDASCTEDGTKYSICQRCSDIKDIAAIPAKGHSFSERIGTEPTCTENGHKTRVCSDCDLAETETLTATGHTYGEWTGTEPTCTEEGHKTAICSVCGDVQTQTLPALDHDWISRGITQQQGTESVYEIFECSRCKKTMTKLQEPDPVEEGNISISNYSAAKGNEVKVVVDFQTNPGIRGFKLHLRYDQTILTPIRGDNGNYVQYGNLLKNEKGLNIGDLKSNLDQNDGITEDPTVSWTNSLDADDITGNGELFYITFKVTDDAESGVYPIDLSYEQGDFSDNTGASVMPTVSSGSVAVVESEFLLGDVNLDGRRTSEDIELLARYIVTQNSERKASMFTERQKKSANVYDDENGNIDIRDGVRLSQIVAGYRFEDNSSNISLSSVSEPTYITAGTIYGTSGQMVRLPVSIKNNNGFAGFNIKISYDKTYLTPIEVYDGDMLDSTDIDSISNIDNHDNSDNISIYYSNNQNLQSDGELFEIEFLISGDAPLNETLPILLTCESGDICGVSGTEINDISVTVVQGSIRLTGNPFQYNIQEVIMTSEDGAEYQSIPLRGDFKLNATISRLTDRFTEATVFAAAYDINGALIFVASEQLLENMTGGETCSLYIAECDANINEIRLFVWNSASGLQPLAERYDLNDI